MCGVSAILLGDTRDTNANAAIELHESLYFLQHRGQDAAGIATCLGGRIFQCKGNGMAAKVFDEGRRIPDLPGWMGIAHLRYPTAGTSSAREAQPFYVNSPFGLSLAVNGNLVNASELVSFLDREARRHVNTDSDSELMLNVFAHALNELGKNRANMDDVFTALRELYARCHGAFACTAMIAGFGILGFRDENGIRPLCLGSRDSTTLPGAKDYFMASESVALKQGGFENIVDILPGQAVFIPKGGSPQFRQIVERKSYTPDVFEYVYFARPDSKIDGLSVHRSRQIMGLKLAKKMREVLGEQGIQDIDVVIPVPETSNTAAAILAESLNRPFSNAFVKNRYVYRTFILPGQKARKKGVRRKLSPIADEFAGRAVCLVDDSIVRGTTSREIVQMAREAGATRVLFVSCSPEVTHPHVHGIDLADPTELIAHGKTADEVATLIGADKVIYQDLSDLKDACIEAAGDKATEITDFEVGVFCGKYKTVVPSGYFAHLSDLHGPQAKNPLANGAVKAVPGSEEDVSMHDVSKS
ncbi:Amidophosphoribosyltransferase [Colletotrichum orbiculare MAFF 240422]|uniref:Amidophosphoribosyltransferase n=1 Tax=Colletotrichum orbiculare (strain 104-T / ATCC 96160 / CBS 514.97 / LARS 414 / MAFF 240422) TaxID=1213857 RepID=A0A484FEM9_COLOR|nr:Amidophosphoribosyltransferase [Colletotrichum orbiculare MAFF 240422]